MEKRERKQRHPRFVLYPRPDGRWDWRLLGSNGKIVATSHHQGFNSKQDAERSVARLREIAVIALVEVSPDGP